MQSGQADDKCIHEAIPVWSFLCIREAEGAGDQKHRLDIGVCCAASSCENRQLYTHHSVACLLATTTSSALVKSFYNIVQMSMLSH